MRKLFLIFILSFVFNFVWENIHSYLYSSINNGAISELILLRATFADAIIITLLSLLFMKIPYLRKRIWLIIPIGIIISIFIELWALKIGYWSYNQYMPIIPYLKVGLTPAIQLGLLGFIIFTLVFKNKK